MLTRPALLRLTWLTLLGPVIVYALIYYHCLSSVDHDRQLKRRRLSFWIQSRYTLPVNVTERQGGLSGSNPLQDSENEASRNNIPQANLITMMTNTTAVRSSRMDVHADVNQHPMGVAMVVRNISKATGNSNGLSESKSKGFPNLVADVNEKTQTNLTKGRFLFKGSNDVYEKVAKNTGLKKYLNSLGSLDPFVDGEDEEDVDGPNVNADVKRAVPHLKVKRYVDEPIDPHSYRLMHNPSSRCHQENGHTRPVFVLFLVMTAPGNAGRRSVIRETFGSEKEWPALKRGAFTTLFMLGKPSDHRIQRSIDEEARQYHDIIQEDFVDSYANLSRKTVMGLKWATNYCRHAVYVMKIDDDSMINQGRFLWIFKSATLTNWTASETLEASPVLRDTDSKYFISKEYYPATTYPPYMNGPGYLLSSDLVENAYRTALTTPLFPWEDVFLGTCLQKLGVKPIIHKRFLWISNENFFKTSSERVLITKMRSYVVISNMEPNHMKFMWVSCKIRIVNPG